MSFSEQAVSSKPCAHPEQRRSNNWPKGVSGNPLGKALGKYRSAEQLARRNELAAAIGTEFPNPTPFEAAMIHAAADLLERAEHKVANNQSVRMANSAMKMIALVRDSRAARPPPAPPPLSSYEKARP